MQQRAHLMRGLAHWLALHRARRAALGELADLRELSRSVAADTPSNRSSVLIRALMVALSDDATVSLAPNVPCSDGGSAIDTGNGFAKNTSMAAFDPDRHHSIASDTVSLSSVLAALRARHHC